MKIIIAIGTLLVGVLMIAHEVGNYAEDINPYNNKEDSR